MSEITVISPRQVIAMHTGRPDGTAVTVRAGRMLSVATNFAPCFYPVLSSSPALDVPLWRVKRQALAQSRRRSVARSATAA